MSFGSGFFAVIFSFLIKLLYSLFTNLYAGHFCKKAFKVVVLPVQAAPEKAILIDIIYTIFANNPVYLAGDALLIDLESTFT